jgi:hypothetical protein
MADDVLIEATAGPYAGQRLTVPAADAKQAIADGWARDPFATELEEPKEMTEEKRAKVAEAADKAARKLRGEDDADKKKSMEADKPEGYTTRSTAPKSR